MGIFKKATQAVASGLNASAPAPKGFMGKAIHEAALKMKAQEDAAASARAIAAAKKQKEQEDQAAYAERLRRSPMGAQAMKKGGAVKKKVTVKAKPVVKAKARKK